MIEVAVRRRCGVVVGCVVAVKQEKAELDRRESIEKFDKDQLKKTNTVEKNPLPDSQGLKRMELRSCLERILYAVPALPRSITLIVHSALDQRLRGRGFESAGCGLSCSNRGPVTLCTLGLGLLNPPSSRGR